MDVEFMDLAEESEDVLGVVVGVRGGYLQGHQLD